MKYATFAATRLGDICTGHGCWPPRPNDQASTNTFINSLGAHRFGDHWETHCCPHIPECHDSVTSEGSTTVFVNGKSATRIGDGVACGSVIAQGSPSVFIGG
jgi:uncharacterized Zn-binding protein involved in type VI secretion